jgi:hypothetical protein
MVDVSEVWNYAEGTEYEINLKQLVSDIFRIFQNDFDQSHSSILNGFIGINVIKRLFTYVDI